MRPVVRFLVFWSVTGVAAELTAKAEARTSSGSPATPAPATGRGVDASRAAHATGDAQAAASGAGARLLTLGRARRLLESGAAQDAETLLATLIAEADREGDHATASLAEGAMGRARSLLGDTAGASRWFDAAETRARTHGSARALAWTFMLRGNDAYGRGERDAARTAWERARDGFERAGDVENQAAALRALAAVSGLDAAESFLTSALTLARQANAVGIEGNVLHALSDIAFGRGLWARALALASEALPLVERQGTPIELARARLSLARLYRSHGRLGDARAAYGSARDVLARIPRGIGVSQAWSLLSTGLTELGDLDAGAAAAREAARTARASGSRPDAAVAAYALSNALVRRGDAAEALGVLDGQSAPNTLARGLAVSRAVALSRLGRHAEALAAATAADAVEGDVLDALPLYPLALAEVRERAGAVDQALADVRRAVDQLERLRQQSVPGDQLRSAFDEGFQYVHGRAIRMLARHGQAAEALEATERARARAFRDLLAVRDLDRGRASRGDDTLRLDVRSMAEAARRLDSVVLAYWTADDGVLIWAITAEGLAAHRAVAVSRDRLAALVARTWDANEPLAGSGRPSAYRELHTLLVQPVQEVLDRAGARRVTLVPHGPLFRLSFAGLQGRDGRHLVETYAMHSAPSMAIGFTDPAAGPAPGHQALIVSNPEIASDRPWAKALLPLPGAVVEGRSVARTLKAADDQVITGRRATKRDVRDRVIGRGVLHFATHAVASDAEPMESFLALAPAPDGADDGRLTAAEVYGLSLDADLVVLSGCRTASGLVTGDGVVGLSRAFFVAGARSIVASLWDLPDLAGQQLLPAFYRTWTAGANKADALRDAQLRMLRGLRRGRFSVETGAGPVRVPAHPAVWSGLVMLGQP